MKYIFLLAPPTVCRNTASLLTLHVLWLLRSPSPYPRCCLLTLSALYRSSSCAYLPPFVTIAPSRIPAPRAARHPLPLQPFPPPTYSSSSSSSAYPWKVSPLLADPEKLPILILNLQVSLRIGRYASDTQVQMPQWCAVVLLYCIVVTHPPKSNEQSRD